MINAVYYNWRTVNDVERMGGQMVDNYTVGINGVTNIVSLGNASDGILVKFDNGCSEIIFNINRVSYNGAKNE